VRERNFRDSEAEGAYTSLVDVETRKTDLAKKP
jgi:hypothetical protein